jgi:hypothetical protein
MFRINYGKRCILCKLPYKLYCKTFVKQVTEVTIKLLVMPPKRKRKAEPVSINKDKPATKKRRKTRKKCPSKVDSFTEADRDVDYKQILLSTMRDEGYVVSLCSFLVRFEHNIFSSSEFVYIHSI